MIRSYFKTAWRNLGKNKTHSFINIAGLAIGMTVAILIGLWIYDEVSFNKNFKNYDRVAQVIQNVTNNGEIQTWEGVPYPLSKELRDNYGSDFKYIAMSVNWADHYVSYGDKKLKRSGGYFEKEMPEIFSLEILNGSSSLEDPKSVLISASSATAFFGDGDPLNKVLSIDNNSPVKVTGVYKDFPQNSTLAELHFMSTWDFYVNELRGVSYMQDPWRPNFVQLYVQLNDNADLKAASLKIKDAKLKRVNEQLAKKKPELFLQPMSNWHLYSRFENGVNVGGAIQYVWMFGIIGVFVLLLACINFMNLSTARSEKRAKEVGIRKAIGSLRRQLTQQFFSESLLTVVFAFVMSLLIVKLILPFFNEVSGKEMSILWGSFYFWLANIGFILFTTLIAGSYPAFYLSSFRPVKVLKGTFKAGRFAALPRKVLVVIQFTVSVSLIIGTIIVYRQIQFAKDRPVGYTREGLVAIPTYVDTSIHVHFDALRNELLRTGKIISMAEASSPPTGIWGSSSGYSWKGKDPNLSVDFKTVRGSYDLGKTIGWHVKQGRDFSRDFKTDSAAYILNEAAVRFMGLQNPIGEIITSFDRPSTVIGVIDDMVMESPYEAPKPTIYSLTNSQGSYTIVKIDPKVSVNDALKDISVLFKKYSPSQPFEYEFVDQEYAGKFSSEERIGKLSGFFALLAILISCLGLFGLASFVAEQRTREIGIRKVLGASVFGIWNLLSKDFLVLVIISFVISVPLAWYGMSKWLLDYTYRIKISWEIFLIAGAASLIIALITVSFQSIKAAVANPIKSLRTE